MQAMAISIEAPLCPLKMKLLKMKSQWKSKVNSSPTFGIALHIQYHKAVTGGFLLTKNMNVCAKHFSFWFDQWVNIPLNLRQGSH